MTYSFCNVCLNGFARLARYFSYCVLWNPKSSNFNYEPPTGNTSPYTKDTLIFCPKEQYAPSFDRSRFKYGVRSLNTQHFHGYCSSKNVLFMGQSDLDPRTIDLDLNVILFIEIVYQYDYVSQVERLNYGKITACLRKGSAYRCRLSRNKRKVLMEMRSLNVKYIFEMNVSYLDNTKFIQFIESLLP